MIRTVRTHWAYQPYRYFATATTKRLRIYATGLRAADGGSDSEGTKTPDRVLDGFRVVLVSPKHAGNVGSVCRLCDCFEASELVLVDPRCDVDDERIRVLAVDKPQNSAPNESLSRMRVALSLKDALADCTASIAFTRRTGNLRKTTHSSVSSLLSSSSAESSRNNNHSSSSSILQSKAGSTALVFGREESGLTTDEIQLCSLSCSIPTGTVQPSLNLSHAVGIVLSDLFEEKLRWIEPDTDEGSGSSGLKHVASSDDIDKLIDRWALVTSLVGLETEEITSPLSRRRKKKILGHLRAILSRAQATDKELKALHGLCSAILELDDNSQQ